MSSRFVTRTRGAPGVPTLPAMTFLCLLLSGAALLVTGLGLLGRLPGRDSAHFSGLIGTLQLVVAVVIAATADGDAAALWSAAGVLLFGLTYLYVAVDQVRALGGAGLGWFCGLVAVLGLVFAGHSLAADPLSAVLWISWAVLWALFFALLALGRASLTSITGWALVIVGPITTVVPALLGLSAAWPTGPLPAVAAAVAIIAGFVAAGLLARRAAAEPANDIAADPAPAPA